MMQFIEVQPTVENYWRALILFGRNVASYKFALGKALLELRAAPGDLIKLGAVRPIISAPRFRRTGFMEYPVGIDWISPP
jgi:hypothetical protein